MIYLLLADGFEEIEALCPVDMLRRAGHAVKTVGVTGKTVTGAHGIPVVADITPEEMDKPLEMLILPGGMPGTKHLDEWSGMDALLARAEREGSRIAAICAAPSILGHLGLLRGRRATAFPSFRDQLTDAILTEGDVVRDGPFLTAPGLGAAIPFALALVETLEGPAAARDTAGRIGWRQN